MSILYTPAGDTDPIRDCHDGSMLHIIRHYHPHKVVIFLSKDMVAKEDKNHIYTKAIHHLAPNCEIELIRTDITEPQKLEKLIPMVEEFVKLRTLYPDEEILLNLSSGTPQMKTIMSFLGTDFDNVRAIQVNSSKGSSNRENHAERAEDIEVLIETNEDNEGNTENRCVEAPLSLYVRYSVRHQIIALVKAYEYAPAWNLYKKNKAFFSKKTGELLAHANLRSKLQLDEAFKHGGQRLSKNKEVNKIGEFFMVMELRQRRGELAEFIVKLTPFLYQLVLFYMEYKTSCPPSRFCSYQSEAKSRKIQLDKLQQIDQKLVDALNCSLGTFRDNSDLSFSNMLILLGNLADTDQELLAVLKDLRRVEAKHRNTVAHTIANLTEELLKNTDPYYSSAAIVQRLRKAFFLVMKDEQLQAKNIYDKINEEIIISMDKFAQ